MLTSVTARSARRSPQFLRTAAAARARPTRRPIFRRPRRPASATTAPKRTTCATEENLTGIVCPTSACLASVTEEPALLDYFDCQIAKQCSLFFNDDDCVLSAGTPDAERDAWRTQCAARFTECGVASDLCGVFAAPLLRKQWMHAADPCLKGACADLETCIAALPVPDCW